MSEQHIVVVILNWNQKADTIECLNSLRQVHWPPFTVLLIDNGSVDGSADEISTIFPEVSIIRNCENLGYAEGNNVGIRKALEAGAAYVLLLNNDTVVHHEFLAELIRAAELHPEAAILGPKVVYHDRPDLLWSLGGNLQRPLGRMKMLGKDQPASGVQSGGTEFDHVPGAAMFVRSEVFRQVGLLDTEFFLNWEDVDFCLRARKAGWKVMGVPESLVRHKVSRATAGKLAMYFGRRNRLLFAFKHLPRWQFLGLVLPLHVVRLITLIATETCKGHLDLARAAMLGTVDFFRGRLGKGSMTLVQRF